MPKRSNQFQRLIHSINAQLATGAVVSESKLIEHRLTGTKREVDIAIEYETPPYKCIIGVECIDKSRPGDVTWVEQMAQKHSHLTDKLILVSKAGFTDEAIRVASALGIETLTLGEAVAADWTKVVGKMDRVYLALPQSRVLSVELSYGCHMPAEPEYLLQPETRLYSPDRSWHCTLNEYAMFVLSQNNITEFVLRNFSTPGDHLFHLSVPIAQVIHVVDKFDISHAVTNIVFRALVHVDDRIPVDLEHRSYKDAQVGHGTITLPGAEGLLTVVEMRGRPLSSDLRFSPTQPTTKPSHRRPHAAPADE